MQFSANCFALLYKPLAGDCMRSDKREIVIRYNALLKRLPYTYPKPSLVVHSSFKSLNDMYKTGQNCPEDHNLMPVAFCNPEDNTVHIAVLQNKYSMEELLRFCLHEIGHLYALEKYGEEDPRWDDDKLGEKFADKFASRWINRLKKEKWL